MKKTGILTSSKPSCHFMPGDFADPDFAINDGNLDPMLIMI